MRAIEPNGAWPTVEPLVLRALEHDDGCHTAASIRKALAAGKMQLWVDSSPITAICITEIVVYPATKRCNIFLLAGHDIDAWIWQLPALESWAREKGCSAMELQGRPGWERILPGYVKTAVHLRKAL